MVHYTQINCEHCFDATTQCDEFSVKGYFEDVSAFDPDPLRRVKELSTSPHNF